MVYFWGVFGVFSARKETGGLGGGGVSRESGAPALPASPEGTIWCPSVPGVTHGGQGSLQQPLGLLHNLGSGSSILTPVCF